MKSSKHPAVSDRLVQTLRISAVLAGVAVVSGCATLAPEPESCPNEAQVTEAMQRFVALEPLPNPPATLTMAGAQCGRDKLVQKMAQFYGPVVGYKAGLTNPAVQKRFNYDKPVRGVLFEKMLLADGATVPAKFGARPMFEADLVVRVKSSNIHFANSIDEVLQHIDAVIPFIELPDLVVADPGKITGPTLNFINVGARLGVLGKPIVVSGQAGLRDALRDMTVRVADGSGKELDAGKGAAILDHPLNAVMWLVRDLGESGIKLKQGDLLSLGSFSRLMPPQAGQSVKVTYEGLPGNPSVSVSFR